MTRAPSLDDDRLARLALSQLFEPGDTRILSLAAELGATRLHAMLSTELDLAGVHDEVSGRLAAQEPARDLETARRSGFRWVVPGDPEWPVQVGDLDHAEQVADVGLAPLGLWVRGPLRLDQLPTCLAVVGSRSSTSYGEQVARQVAVAAAEAGLCVVSGAAFGIDQAAHRGALAGSGATVAVLACGVDRFYPREHVRLLEHIAAEGAIVSEVSPGRAPLKSRFLARNRVIAALSGGTVVVEAALRSGALNTANWTARLHRPLMGVPGPVTSASSAGVHHLIRTGAATLVTDGPTVLEMVGHAGEHLMPEPRMPDRPRDRLDPRRRRVLEAVPVRSAADSVSIARSAGLGLVEVRSALSALERLGMVTRDPSGWRLDRADPSGPSGPSGPSVPSVPSVPAGARPTARVGGSAGQLDAGSVR